MNKSIFTYTIAVILFLSLLSSTSAITGRLGNSRMVLTLDEGESVERYVLVQNSNDVPITIEIETSGDLADSVNINEKTFVLQPGDERKAYFTITADKPGTTETKVHVKFTPEEGSGVGLSSTIIVIAPGENQDSNDGFFNFLNNEDDEPTADENDTNVNVGIGGNSNIDPETESSKGMSTTMILTISTIVLILIFVVLLVYAGIKSKSKKRHGRPRE